jgi:hypothetical protein
MRRREERGGRECQWWFIVLLLKNIAWLIMRRLYLVSVGSNPTGITISAGRRREIYEVCKKFGTHTAEPRAQLILPVPKV